MALPRWITARGALLEQAGRVSLLMRDWQRQRPGSRRPLHIGGQAASALVPPESRHAHRPPVCSVASLRRRTLEKRRLKRVSSTSNNRTPLNLPHSANRPRGRATDAVSLADFRVIAAGLSFLAGCTSDCISTTSITSTHLFAATFEESSLRGRSCCICS